MGLLPWSGYQEKNRGFLLDLSFLSAPQVSHQLQYEASWRLLSCLDKSSAFAGTASQICTGLISRKISNSYFIAPFFQFVSNVAIH